jgi:hypothetical protein
VFCDVTAIHAKLYENKQVAQDESRSEIVRQPML